MGILASRLNERSKIDLKTANRIEIAAAFEAIGFESVGAPFMFPTADDINGAAFYSLSAALDDGKRVSLRAFGTAFNLVPRQAFRAGLDQVYTIGPGVVLHSNVPEVTVFMFLAQWFGASDIEAARFVQILEKISAVVLHDTALVHGRPCARFAVLPFDSNMQLCTTLP